MSGLFPNSEAKTCAQFVPFVAACCRRAAAMDSWGWVIVLAAVTAVTVMLLMVLHDEISRRKWLAKSGAERLSTSAPHRTKRLD